MGCFTPRAASCAAVFSIVVVNGATADQATGADKAASAYEAAGAYEEIVHHSHSS